MLVRIYKYWGEGEVFDDFVQTPGRSGEWGGVKFVIDEPGEADCAIIHGHIGAQTHVTCPKDRVWLILGEPPNENLGRWQRAPRWISRIYTTDESMRSERHRLSYPGSPWHVRRDYDYLSGCPVPAKTHSLSWITSNRTDTRGHRFRMEYLSRVSQLKELSLFGRGFEPIEDKWDGLAPYRYSMAFENYQNGYYFTEKVMDCFLAWTMPIYYGCSNLEAFFPKESFIRLDPNSPNPVADLERIVASSRWEQSLAAIAEARHLVLNQYNLFAFIARELEAAGASAYPKTRIQLSDHTYQRPNPVARVIRSGLRAIRSSMFGPVRSH